MIVGTGASNRGGWSGLFAVLEHLSRFVSDSATVGEVTEVDYDASSLTIMIDGEQDLKLIGVPWVGLRAGTLKVYSAPSVGEKVLVVCPGGNLKNAIAVPGIVNSNDPYSETGSNIHKIELPGGDTVKYDSSTQALVVNVTTSAVINANGNKITVDGSGIELDGDTTVKGVTTQQGDVGITGNVTITGTITLNGTMSSTGNVTAPNIP